MISWWWGVAKTIIQCYKRAWWGCIMSSWLWYVCGYPRCSQPAFWPALRQLGLLRTRLLRCQQTLWVLSHSWSTKHKHQIAARMDRDDCKLNGLFMMEMSSNLNKDLFDFQVYLCWQYGSLHLVGAQKCKVAFAITEKYNLESSFMHYVLVLLINVKSYAHNRYICNAFSQTWNGGKNYSTYLFNASLQYNSSM